MGFRRSRFGSSVLTKYEYQEGKPILLREPKVFFVDDFTGKAMGLTYSLASGLAPHSEVRAVIERYSNGPKGPVVQGS